MSEPQTIALVDAYNDLDAEADLNVYSEEFSLPACTTGNGCFEQVNQNGEAANLPFPQSNRSREELEATCESEAGEPLAREAACKEVQEADGWAAEISLDIEVAHAVCQNCRIVLVEANDAEEASLEAAEDAAVEKLGATEISNSWGGGEPLTDSEAFNHPGTVITAASGDNAYLNWNTSYEEEKAGVITGSVNYPASSPHVVAVGGTRLTLSSPGEAWVDETAWYDGGSGCSVSFEAGEWQYGVSDWSSVGCENRRAVADVSADASPYTGVAIYDSVRYVPLGSSLKAARVLGWTPIGGTSVASPIVASMFALAGGAHGVDYPARTLYSHVGSAALHDVSEGANGECGNHYSSGCTGSMKPLSLTDCGQGVLICNAAGGYDGPGGVGAPNGVEAFRPSRQYTGGGPEAPTTEACGGSIGGGGEQAVCGKVNPHANAKAGYYFAYNRGTSCTGGKETSLMAEVQGEAIPVSGELTGLEPATEYTSCLIATDASGETQGAPLTFTTEPAAPKPPRTFPSANVSATSATLNGELGSQPVPASWYYRYAPQYICTWGGASSTAEQQDSKPGEVDEVAAAVSGLQPGTLYDVCLVASNRVGSTVGSETWFMTKSLAPSIEHVAAQSSRTEATLEGTVDPNAQEATCEFDYGTSESYGSSVPCEKRLGNSEGHVLAIAHITNLIPGTTYYYHLVVHNEVGHSASNEGDSVFTTSASKPVVTGASASDMSATTTEVAGSIKTETKARYRFEYGETEAFGQSTAGGEVAVTGSEVSIGPEKITGLKPATSYYYRLQAANASGEAHGEAKTFTTAASGPLVASLSPATILATPAMTTTRPVPKPIAFSDLLLAAIQHGRSLLVELTVELAGSRVQVDITAPAGHAAGAKRSSPAVVLAWLVRVRVGIGKLRLRVPLNAEGRQALRSHKHLRLTVKIRVTPPPDAQPRAVVRTVDFGVL